MPIVYPRPTTAEKKQCAQWLWFWWEIPTSHAKRSGQPSFHDDRWSVLQATESPSIIRCL